MAFFLSVIIPVYNGEAYLQNAILSIINQRNFRDCEIILVDDGSTDASAGICDSFSEKYDNIITVHQKNSGVSVARNNGLKMASKDRIAFLDADDYFMPDAFEKFGQYDADMICFDFSKGNGGCISEFVNFDFTQRDTFKDTLYPAMALSDAFFNCWNKIYKKDIIDKYGLRFEPGLKYGEDMKFVYEYIKVMNTFSFIREPLYFYNVNENSTTNNIVNEYEIYRSLYLWLCEYFKSVDCDHEKCQRMIESNFVYKSWMAVSAIGKKKFISGVNKLRNMLNDDLFISLYEKEGYDNFQSRYDSLVDRQIKNRNAIALMAICKIYNKRGNSK